MLILIKNYKFSTVQEKNNFFSNMLRGAYKISFLILQFILDIA